ncbi:family 43 glycosylhydrolase [Ohtaekwangia koreensis]|nr:family 43 glycosylhydrolase [Ohtaekwangia koreensis]
MKTDSPRFEFADSVVYRFILVFFTRLKMIRGILCLLMGMLLISANPVDNPGPYTAYLFTYFTGGEKGDEQIRFALSEDGFNYIALHDNKPILSSAAISSTGGVRDPHILRACDGKTFFMVATDMHVAKNEWGPNVAMVMMKSPDLVHWTHAVVNVPEKFPEFAHVNRVWAPQTIYDPALKKYMLYWSMRLGNGPDKIYYAYANKDFTDLETTPKQLFFSPTNSACIDADIIYHDGKYNMFFKTEGADAGIKKAVSEKINEGYVSLDRYLDQTDESVEGAGVFKLNNDEGWILMYDVYKKGAYQFTQSKDLLNFTVVDKKVSMDFHPRHGTVMAITTQEYKRLLDAWFPIGNVLSGAQNKSVRSNNTVVEGTTVTLSVSRDTDLSRLDPQFTFPKVYTLKPAGPQDFSKGPVKYTVAMDKKVTEIEVGAVRYGNPVLNGYFADPDILYSEKEKKFYLYPTSDGFVHWSGRRFKTFSSTDLLHWRDEGVILDLEKDVSWAKANAWAPTIVETKRGSGYRYYYYFTAGQKIGVASSDSPVGPFVDKGKPLIDFKPQGVNGGQEIDPAVFLDPVSKNHFLYWGNGYMAGVRLHDDMVSFNQDSVRVLTPDATFREGTYVIFRKGIYYFFWSEDDTRSAEYKVRYGTSDSPLGPIRVARENIVIRRNDTLAIRATGHNSIIQIPGRDEWYIVYHRFTRPQGDAMGGAAGYHREVCIDRLKFNADGTIEQVIPTLNGIEPVALH